MARRRLMVDSQIREHLRTLEEHDVVVIGVDMLDVKPLLLLLGLGLGLCW